MLKTSYFFNDSKWKDMALSCSKIATALSKGIRSKHYGDFYCLNCLHSFRIKKKLESHKKLCKNKDFCNVIISSVEVLGFNKYQKSDKAPCIIFADLECIIEGIDQWKNNPENSSAKIGSKYIPSGFSESTMSSFRSIENKHSFFLWMVA